MKTLLRNLGAALAGVVAGVIGVSLVQGVSNALYAPPDTVDLNDAEQLGQWIQGLPVTAFLIVLLSWGVGCFLAGCVARWLAVDRVLWPALVAVVIPFLATLGTLAMLPHPVWMWPGAILVCLAGGIVGIRCGKRRTRSPDAVSDGGSDPV